MYVCQKRLEDPRATLGTGTLQKISVTKRERIVLISQKKNKNPAKMFTSAHP